MLKLKRRKSISTGMILLYHRVATLDSDPWQLCVSPRNFRQQMQFVHDTCRAVSLAEMKHSFEPRTPRPLVAVTFDDGYADNLHEALPVLEQFGIPATFFLTIPWLGPPREFWWDELDRIFLQPGTLPPTLRLASDAEAPTTWRLGDAVDYTAQEADENRQWRAWQHPPTLRHAIYGTLWKRLYRMMPKQRQCVLDELLEWVAAEGSERPSHRRLRQGEVIALSRSGLVEIGAHTVSHPALPTLPRPHRKREITLSRLSLAELVDRPVTSFAFPHGDYCPKTIRLVREAGFLRGCTTRADLVKKEQDDYELPRFSVGDWDGNEFAKHVAAWHTSSQD